MNFLKKNKKKILLTFLILFFVLFLSLFYIASNLVRHGYDRQSKIYEITKSIIPAHFFNKIKKTLLYIPDLKARNEFLEIQLKKYEQGFKGEKFKSKIFELNNNKFEVNFFFTPFKRLDTNLGWNAQKNSLRAHYAEIKDDKVFLISGEGQTIFFEKENLLSENLNFKNLPNNINDILTLNNSELIGIRDLYFHNNQILISMMIKDQQGITINLYKADLNYKKINFEILFKTNEYWENYNVFSGGRIENFDKDNILFATGYVNKNDVAQQLDNLLGKIIKINLATNDFKIISIGHRNPQGLEYLSKYNLIFNSEHGPKGGDEININKLNEGKEIKNYGWDIASYGTAYDGTDPYKKSHLEYGFEEPSAVFTPAIGISEILFFENNSLCERKCLLVSSLRAHSLYIYDVEDNFDNLVSNGRIYLKNNRIRDVDYDADLELIIILSENVPAILTLKKL